VDTWNQIHVEDVGVGILLLILLLIGGKELGIADP
jgi:hypothetical protein